MARTNFVQPRSFTCFLIGGSSLLTRCAEILLSHKCHINGIITEDFGNQQWAAEHDIPYYDPRADLFALMSNYPFDYLFSIVNSYVLPENILKLPKKHTINYHDSLLPNYAGVYATSWAIMNQEKMHGITWHLATQKVDAGDIVKQDKVEISPTDTAFVLNAKCYEKAASIFNNLVEDLIYDRIEYVPQEHTKRTYYSLFKRPKAACFFSFNQEAAEIEAFVRALTFGKFYPNRLGCPKIAIDNHCVIIKKISCLASMSRKKAGTIIDIDNDSISVSTLTHDVAIEQVNSIDGLSLSIKDFAKKHHLKKGYRFKDMDPELYERVTELNTQICRYETYWVNKLKECQQVSVPYMNSERLNLRSESVISRFQVPEEFSSYLHRIDEGMDISCSLIAAFVAYLGRLCSTGRFDIGFKQADSRNLPNGIFAPFVPLRVELDFTRTFTDFREVIQKEMNEISKNKTFLRDVVFRYPELNPESDAQIISSPSVSIVLVKKPEDFQNDVSSGLSMVISQNTGDCFWAYRAELLNSVDARRMTEQFACFLHGITADPEQPIQFLPLMGSDELKKILVDWNSDSVDFPQNACIHQLFEEWAEKRPEEIAVVLEDQQLSYQLLNTRANQLAHYLIKEGVGPDVLVGLCLERSIMMIVGMLGVLKAGGAYVPLDSRYPKERLIYMLQDARVHVLITQEKLAGLFVDLQIPVACLDTNADKLPSERKENPVREMSSENLAYVIYTSGSTGQSKGVMITHRNVVGFIFSYKQVTLDGEKRIGTSVAPFNFDTSVEEIYSTLCFGGTLHIVHPEKSVDVEYFARYLVDNRITTTYILPDFLSGVARNLEKARDEMNLKCVITGLAPKRENALQSFRNLSEKIRILNAYGPTEVTYGATAFDFKSSTDPDRFAPIGVPFPNYEVFIVDARLEPVPVGIAGELLIGGVGLARGYLNQPELTAQKFIPHPFKDEPGSLLYKTGDLCRFLPDGNIEFLGRLDHQVKVRGYRIELGEIEAFLLKHPGVKKAFALAREDKPGNKRLVAYIVTNQKPNPTISELRNFLKNKLPDYMVPSAFVILDSLPLMSNGKVDIHALPAPDKLRPVLESPYLAPRTAIEKRLADIMAEALDMEEVGVQDDFFELGGDSLMAVGLVAEIEKAFSIKLPLSILFQASTIEQLVNAIQLGESDRSWASLVEIQRGGSKTPVFFIHSSTGDVLFYRDLARHLGTERPVFGLQSQGLDGKQPVSERIEEMAAHYIEEIRAVQPKGPYFLGGYCMGGLIAYEMAQQLHKDGQEVGFLAMIDTYNYNEIPRQRYFGEGLVLKMQKLEFHLVNILRLSPRNQLDYLMKKLRVAVGREFARFSLNLSNLLKMIQPGSENMKPNVFLEDRNEKASFAYKPQDYPGEVTLFRPHKNYSFVRDPQMRWGDLAKGGLEIVELPVNPGGIFVEPYVRILSSKLRERLEKLDYDMKGKA
ncbi:MAG: amino acid adenylation domain-containing protein [Candidatus Aminicenantes bacterium]|nr:amino acid adenylation domain-containing protein [Candidatus Aminicenantes bacterium]